MNLFFISISLVAGLQAFAKVDRSRLPAETHGGVMRSNAQFQAVTKFALDEGGDLDRVFMIKKRIDCLTDIGAIYEIQYGGQNSQTGKESYHEKKLVSVSEPKDGMADPATVTVTKYNGNMCK